MSEIFLESFNGCYSDILTRLYTKGKVCSPRGMRSLELIAHQFTCDPNQNIITIDGFETNIDYAHEELAWYESGTDRIDWSKRIERAWKKFSDDGIHVNSAYGNRIFGQKEGFVDQFQWCVSKLKHDPDSRQCVININSHFDKNSPTKDFPCCIASQVLLRDNKLDWITIMRSQDVFLGLRNDVYCFTELQKRMANDLNVKTGQYTHFSGSLHLYENNWHKIESLFGKIDVSR